MIYTVTFNPSLDYVISVPHFVQGTVNRAKQAIIYPGGKGINVSIVLHNLGIDSIVLGFAAGFTGQEIKRLIRHYQIKEQLISIPDELSRINVKLRSGDESEINGIGPTISAEALDTLYQQLRKLQSGDVLVLAGSIPNSLPPTIYRDIMEQLQHKGVIITVDATKDLLCNVLEFHPFLIKPNHFELGEIFGLGNLKDKKEIIHYAQKLQEQGARNVLVSMAGDGAVLVAEDGTILESPAPRGTVINSVGAGDSMVAGFLYGYLKEKNYKSAFYTGIACGSASAFSEHLATKEDADRIYQSLKTCG